MNYPSYNFENPLPHYHNGYIASSDGIGHDASSSHVPPHHLGNMHWLPSMNTAPPSPLESYSHSQNHWAPSSNHYGHKTPTATNEYPLAPMISSAPMTRPETSLYSTGFYHGNDMRTSTSFPGKLLNREPIPGSSEPELWTLPPPIIHQYSTQSSSQRNEVYEHWENSPPAPAYWETPPTPSLPESTQTRSTTTATHIAESTTDDTGTLCTAVPETAQGVTFLPPITIPDPERLPSPEPATNQDVLSNKPSDTAAIHLPPGQVESNRPSTSVFDVEDHDLLSPDSEDDSLFGDIHSPSSQHSRASSPDINSDRSRSPSPDGQHVQTARKNKKRTDAHKETLRIGRELAKAREKAFLNEFASLEASREVEDAELAKRHGFKKELIEKMKYGRHLKGKRAVNLENAKLSDLAKRVNKDRTESNRIKLPELRAMLRDDPKYKNLSREEEMKLCDDLENLRQQKATGLRPSALSASQDVSSHVNSIHDQIMALSERTNLAAICFFARTDMTQSYTPRWIATPNAMHFSQDAFGKSMWDTTRSLEAWSVTQKKALKPPTFQALRLGCSKEINGALQSITGVANLKMNYKNYDDQIVSKFSVKLVGWTYKEFISPFDINSVGDLRTLHEALTTGACHWVRMSRSQQARYEKDLAARRAKGEEVGIKRKGRSDKGVPRGPRASKSAPHEDAEEERDEGSSSDLEENGRPGGAKRQRTSVLKDVTNKPSTKRGRPKASAKQSSKAKAKAKAQLPPHRTLSTEFVDSSSDEQESGL